jgi:hypothetical protein
MCIIDGFEDEDDVSMYVAIEFTTLVSCKMDVTNKSRIDHPNKVYRDREK